MNSLSASLHRHENARGDKKLASMASPRLVRFSNSSANADH